MGLENTSERILIVDDNEHLLSATSRLLRNAGYDVLTASTGQDGVQLATDAIPDLILLDWVLPDGSGDEICRQIKAAYPHIFIALMSSLHTTSDEQAAGLEAGADEYIVRPISNRELIARVRVLLRLKRAEQSLARYNAELERFTYVTAHHLQEPLRTVVSYTQLLDKYANEQLDAKAQRYMTFVTDAAVHMKHLLRDLLVYIELDKRSLKLADISSEEVLNHVLHTLRDVIQERHARVEHDALPVVHADPSQLAEVFRHLLDNALKFQGISPPRIRVTAQCESDMWMFSVQDHGIGIESEYLERIFHTFERLHSRVDYPGTGIGLATCKKIIERHGGRIWAESKPGEGSTFYFTLPACKANPSPFDDHGEK